jgi:hypothetical protein
MSRAPSRFDGIGGKCILKPMFRDCRLARMSDGHYCFVRDLGPVKGGKGMRHHEVIIDLNRRGMLRFMSRLFARPREPKPSDLLELHLGTREQSQM